ncbi:XRE family transcriptional regulator [Brevibacillus laterosporus]|nr:helix-turn-helix transcriptional regulator [Brevibacillus laterosporus]TPG68922.1 XRE family transcriptional regulator [Brevibacillus laterosporus]
MAKLKCNLGKILAEKKISALQLSIAINHRRSTINDLINKEDIDNNRIPASLIANICSYLKITPNDLFEVDDSNVFYQAAYKVLKQKDELQKYIEIFFKSSLSEKAYVCLKLYEDGQLGLEISNEVNKEEEQEEPNKVLAEKYPNEPFNLTLEEIEQDIARKLYAMALANQEQENQFDQIVTYETGEDLQGVIRCYIEDLEENIGDKEVIKLLSWEEDGFDITHKNVHSFQATKTIFIEPHFFLKKSLEAFKTFDAMLYERIHIVISFTIDAESLRVLKQMKRLSNSVFIYHVFILDRDYELLSSVEEFTNEQYGTNFKVMHFDKETN